MIQVRRILHRCVRAFVAPFNCDPACDVIHEAAGISADGESIISLKVGTSDYIASLIPASRCKIGKLHSHHPGPAAMACLLELQADSLLIRHHKAWELTCHRINANSGGNALRFNETMFIIAVINNQIRAVLNRSRATQDHGIWQVIACPFPRQHRKRGISLLGEGRCPKGECQGKGGEFDRRHVLDLVLGNGGKVVSVMPSMLCARSK